MALQTYHRKRNFKKTSEPKGTITKSNKNTLLFIVQKHAASHLHYDFRLEWKGVLMSWAVPKGPSLDPTIKRLAVHVEDHPIEYGSFEGIIPQGQYGGGTVMLWDKGEWIPEEKNVDTALKKGNLTFTLKAKKLKGKWKLIRIKNNDKAWLLIKVKDEHAKSIKEYDITVDKPNSVTTNKSIDEIAIIKHKTWGRPIQTKNSAAKKSASRFNHTVLKQLKLPKKSFPKIIHPQLATLVDKPPDGNNWLHEIKFDGYRLLAFKNEKNVQLFTRNNHDWTKKFHRIAVEIAKFPASKAILDGEVVVLDNTQHSNFQLLQNALKEKQDDFIYYVFDLLYIQDFNLMSLPLIKRKKILKKYFHSFNKDIICYSDHIVGSGKSVFDRSCTLGLEGIVSKDIYSHYSQKRDKSWLKIKCIKRQEFVIGGFLPSAHNNVFRSLMLGTFNKDGELTYHGNVGTGFTQSSLKMLAHLLEKRITKKMPFAELPPKSKDAVWVKPTLIAKIEFKEWTKSNILRHPSFKGIREDKSAKSIVKEDVHAIENNEKLPMTILTHPNKILYAEGKITKKELADYYVSVQKWILPYITNRLLTFVCCPENYHHCFYQKHIANKTPTGLYKFKLKENKAPSEYLYIKDAVGLLALPQLNILEIHSWGSQITNIDHPDMMVFDIDPAPEVGWDRVVKAAFDIKKTLEQCRLKSFVKTTGGKGLHVVVPIKPGYHWQEIKNFSHVLVKYLVMNNKEDYIGIMRKSARKNKIFIDYLRNQRGATFVAPYSTRARKFAPISTPIAWDELTTHLKDTFFTIKTLPMRLATIKKDPWKDFFRLEQTLRLDELS